MADVRRTCRLLTAVLSGILFLMSAETDGLDTLHDVTWDTAISTCHQRGGKLYNTTDTSALGDVTQGSYWIGGKVQYSSWIWTADKKSLFRYAGELNESYVTSNNVYTTIYDNQTILYDNQASRCYYECRQQNNRKPVYLGLQESSCYCFGSLNLGSITTDNRTRRGCLGNFMECCGTDSTISIYRPELLRSYTYITWSLSPEGTCAYINQNGNIIVKNEDNCMTQKGYICNCSASELNYTCFHHTMDRSWFSANSSCTLKALNENNVEYTRRHLNGGVSYWIGLKRSNYIVWIDRNESVNTDISYKRSGCLMMTKQPSGDISFHISNCSEQNAALCLTYSSFSTPSPITEHPTDQSDGLDTLHDVAWDTASSTCRERGGKLYNTTDTSALGDVTPGSYWIGGKVQYSSWMWSADKQSLFEYAGELNESYANSSRVYTILYDNQASRCYYECRRQQNIRKPVYVGLQENTCYCFGWLNPGSITTDNQTRHRCFGNFMEYCGTDNTISMYHPDLISSYSYIAWSLDPDGTCAYIAQTGRVIVKAEDNCMTQKGYICNCSKSDLSYTCLHHTMDRNWFSANSSCTLKTLNENNVEYIRRHMNVGVSYWIGLKRSKYIVWNDRDERVNTEIRYNISGCLMMQKRPSGDISFHIANCSEQKSALCLADSSFSTPSPITEHPSDQSGVAVGVSVTAVVVVGVVTLLAVFWMKRRRLYCFGEKPRPTPRDNPTELTPPAAIQSADTNLSPAGEANYEKLDDISHTSQNTYENTPRQPDHVYSGLHTQYYNVTQSTNNVDS